MPIDKVDGCSASKIGSSTFVQDRLVDGVPVQSVSTFIDGYQRYNRDLGMPQMGIFAKFVDILVIFATIAR